MAVQPGDDVRRRLRDDILAALAIFIFVAAVFAAWYLHLSQKEELLSSEIGRLEGQWMSVSSDLEGAHRLDSHVAAFLNETRQIAEDNQREPWTPALQCIATSAGPDVELRVIRVWRDPQAPSGRLLRIEGLSTGLEPRVTADSFCRKLHDELQQHFQLRDGCRLERLDEEPDLPANDPGHRKAAFTIVASIDAAPPSKAPGEAKN